MFTKETGKPGLLDTWMLSSEVRSGWLSSEVEAWMVVSIEYKQEVYVSTCELSGLEEAT